MVRIMKKNLTDIINFFDNYNFNDEEIVLDQCTKITNVEKFVNSHKNYLLKNTGKKVFLPYYNRLLKLYLKLKK